MPNASIALSDFEFFTRRQYFEDLCQRVSQAPAGSRVAISTMILDVSEPLVAQLVDVAEKAARRGVLVYLAVDAYNFTFNSKTIVGPLWWRNKLPSHLVGAAAQTRDSIDLLRAAGAHCTITNLPKRRFTNPFAGRSHIKFAVVDDYQYVGGCNLENAEQIDVMLGWKSATSADWLFGLSQQLDANPNTLQALGTEDMAYALDARSTLLLDVGVKNQSLVLDHALQLIDHAQEWLVLSCQYFPGGVTAQHLVAAHRRGVKIRLLLNDISQQHSVNKAIQRVITPLERRKAPKSFFATTLDRRLPYMHAKILASEKKAMVGSHNYVPAGVAFGTAELTLCRRETAFGQKLVRQVLAQTNFAADSDHQFDFLSS